MSNQNRPSNINISDKVLIGLEKHAYSNLEAEVGGMLFGKVSENGAAEIVGSIPALTAAAEQISLTFTHDVWADILAKGEKQFPGEKIVGWYHTHPSFGLFLSEYDEFIQRNFFSSAGQLALVIDPIAGEMGWFAKTTDDKIELIHKEQTKVGPRSPIKQLSPLQSDWKGRIFTHAAVAVAAAGLTWGLTIALSGPNLESSHQALFENYSSLTFYLQQPNFLYVAEEGDTYKSISKLFYGDASGAENIRLDNGDLDLVAGSLVFVRGPVRFQVSDPSYLPTPATPSPSPTPSSTPADSPKPSESPAVSESPSPSPTPSSTLTPGPITSPSPSASEGSTP
jgi:proteasome lid subunit RPN8/RPN11